MPRISPRIFLTGDEGYYPQPASQGIGRFYSWERSIFRSSEEKLCRSFTFPIRTPDTAHTLTSEKIATSLKSSMRLEQDNLLGPQKSLTGRWKARSLRYLS